MGNRNHIRLIVLLMSTIQLINALNYSDVKELRSCQPLDSCDTKSKQLDNLRVRNCECDEDCSLYGDCCVDAKYVSLIKSKKQVWECRQIKIIGAIYMKSSCPSTWMDDDMRQSCESVNDTHTNSDPLSALPLTDKIRRFTYKNSACAVCNDADLSNLIPWVPRLECGDLERYNRSRGNLTNEYIRENLVYFEDSQQWGIWLYGNDGKAYQYDCVIDPFVTKEIEPLIRPCKSGSIINNCPDSWQDAHVRDACQSYMASVYSRDYKFHNPHCALCNSVNTSLLTCNPITGKHNTFSEFLPREAFRPNAFSMLLDINSIEGNGEQVATNTVCDTNQVYDPFLKKCRKIVCGFVDYKLVNGKCIKQMPQNLNFGSITNNVNNSEISSNATSLSNFMSCPKIYIEHNNYLTLSNGSIYVPQYNSLYNSTHFEIKNNRLLICIPFEANSNIQEKFSLTMGYLSLICLVISIISLVLHLICFIFVPDLNNLSGKNLASLSVSLLISYTCFIVGGLMSTGNTCKIIAIVMYFFFLASFLWMNILATDCWRTLRRATTELRVTNGKQHKRFLLYSFIVWSLTSMAVATAVSIDSFPELVPKEYQPHFGEYKKCWFGQRKALLIFFALPVGIIMMVNMYLFISIAHMIYVTTSNTKKLNDHAVGSTIRRNFRLYWRLSLIMGLSWSFGLIASYIENEYLWYSFIFLNTLQGLFIFIAFCCNAKVGNYFKEKLTSLWAHKKGQINPSSTGSGSAITTNSSLSYKKNSSKESY